MLDHLLPLAEAGADGHSPDAAGHPSDDAGLSRLIDDLRSRSEDHPPAELKEKILRRAAEEPARVETDREGLVVAVNPAFSLLCGYEFSEVKGCKPGTMLQGPDSDPTVVAGLRQAIREGLPFLGNLVNYHKDGSPYRVLVDLEPIVDSAGIVTGFRAVETKMPL